MGHSARSKIGNVSRIPRYGKAVVTTGKVSYLLSQERSNGKWKLFNALGYTEENPEELQHDLREGLKNNGGEELIKTETGEHVYNVVMELGRTSKADVLTVWQIDREGDNPRFITAYKAKKRRSGGETV